MCKAAPFDDTTRRVTVQTEDEGLIHDGPQEAPGCCYPICSQCHHDSELPVDRERLSFKLSCLYLNTPWPTFHCSTTGETAATYVHEQEVWVRSMSRKCGYLKAFA